MTDSPPAWRAVTVSPAMERRVRSGFEEHGLEVYVPMERVWGTGPHRRNPFNRPLVRGYVFVRLGDQAHLVHDVRGALRIVHEAEGEGERPAEIPESWIDMIRRMEEAGDFDETLPRCSKTGRIKRKLEIGEPVRVTGGLYYGAVGKLLRLKGRRRAEALLKWVIGEIKTEIDMNHLEAA